MDGERSYRFYSDAATWWPLISPPAEYIADAAWLAAALRSASAPVTAVLELGSGGGHNASHLKRSFDLTLVDLSEDMLEVSRRLNPECEHLQGDMRTVRLGREFDAVIVHDAIDYMATESELLAAMETAFVHCRPGGVAVFAPDDTAESFAPSTRHGGTDGEDGRAARYLEWTHAPRAGDTAAQTDYVLALRESDGSVEVVHETHRVGLFRRRDWLRLLEAAGFEPGTMIADADADVTQELFLGHRPAR